MAKQMGWEIFFVVCTLVAVPGLLLLFSVFRLEGRGAKDNAA
jgi:hypothetical protein